MPYLTPDYPRKPPRYLYLKSFLPVILILLIFSFGLASFSLLSHFRSPASKQQIGWQSWDVVEIKSSSAGGGQNAEVGSGSGANQTAEEEFVPSIPLDNWDPLSLHTTGLTEIAIKSCYFPPYLFPSFCAPQTTGQLDKTKGKWVIVEKDLNLRTGLWYLNVYYRRTRRLDTPLIRNIRIVDEPVPDTLKSELDGWVKAEGNLHSGTWPTQSEKRLWYKLQEQDWGWRRNEKRQEEISYDYGSLITELDVVYGDDDPFYGFERVQGGKVTEAKAGKWESVDLAIRRGNPIAPRGVVPRFSADGNLKIMQIADLHYSVGTGECRDSDKDPCVGDPDTAAWLGEALDAEEPDLVVFSGDQLNGQETSYDSRSVLAKFAKPVIEREIPWCAVFGNHDSEIADDRDYQMRTLQNMPYSLARAGPKAVDGVGNYFIKLHSHDASRMHLFTLYFLDSGSYQKKALPWSKPEYDYIKESQIEWFLNTSASIKPIQRPFKPDGGEDLGHIWSRKSQPARLARQTTQLAKPNAIMWFHIPLPEAYSAPDVAGFDGDELDVGDQFDGEGNSKHNSGFFYNGIKQVFETTASDDEAVEWGGTSKVTEVKVLSHGHCHNTDRCRRTDGIWMCFDGGSSFSGYGQLGFDRRVRVYQLSQYGEKIETYKRLASGDVIDRQVLVGPGAPAGWGEDQLYR